MYAPCGRLFRLTEKEGSREALYAPGFDRQPAVRLFIAENGIECDEEVVDILQGAHYQEPYASLNPSRMVPMLEDGDFRLSESSAILKYLADKYDLPSYPNDLKKRAKVNEVMDWLTPNSIATSVTG